MKFFLLEKMCVAFLLLFFNLTLFGQNFHIPSKRFERDDLNKVRKKYQENFSGSMFGVGYHVSNFLTPDFNKYSKSGNVKHVFGYNVGIGYTWYNSFMDINWFMSRYKIDVNFDDFFQYKDSTDFKIKHRGFDVSYCLRLIPSKNRWTKNLMPYLGLGYSFSNLVATTDIKKNETTTEYDVVKGKLSTKGLVWKPGIFIHLGKICRLRLEYKQTFRERFKLNKSQFQEFSATIVLVGQG